MNNKSIAEFLEHHKQFCQFRPASREEAGLFYSEPNQTLDEALGTVGHLRMDFGSGGKEFFHTWWPHNEDQFNTGEFKDDLQDVVDALRADGPLKDLSAMSTYCHQNGGAITQDGRSYDIDLDSGDMEAVNIMDGWKRFRIRDVSTAAYFAMKKGNAAPDERWRIFLDRLEERTLNQEPEPEYLTGSRRLCAEDISFAEDIIQNDNLLEFYMEVCFDADQMFGTNVCTTENDDWLNIYANYDLEARRVCDTLEMYLQRGNGDEEAFKYRLSAEEQALLLPKMDAYCQTRLGQTLEECCADYLSEQSQESPEMQM